MTTLHVQGGIQFRPELYRTNRTQWLREAGKALEEKGLSLELARELRLHNGQDLVSFFERSRTDPQGLRDQLGLTAATLLAGYVSDVLQTVDDFAKDTSNASGQKVDLSPQSTLSHLLGLDTTTQYARAGTPFGDAADPVFSVVGIDVRKTGLAPDPLAGRVFVDSTTFTGPRPSFGRRGVELERVNGVSNVEPHALLTALRSTNAAGRSVYQRIRRPQSSEAYTIGRVPFENLRWDNDSHDLREANPYLTMTIEAERYQPDAQGRMELTVGTDINDDVYYDTARFDLSRLGQLVRSRIRWDNDNIIRRLLIGVKTDGRIDEFGFKRNHKVDVRNDNASPTDVENLDRELRSGKSRWGGTLDNIRAVYDTLKDKGLLPTVGARRDVLLLEPKIHVRSTRSRFHLGITPTRTLLDFYGAATGRLDKLEALIEQQKPQLSGPALVAAEALQRQSAGLKDGSLVAARAGAALQAVDPAMTVSAASVKALMDGLKEQSPPFDALTLEKRRIVAEAVRAEYAAFAEALDAARRPLTQSDDRTLEDYPDLFAQWVRSTDSSLLNTQSFEAFVGKLDQLLTRPAAEQEASVAAFNAFGNAQRAAGNNAFNDFEPLTVDQLPALRAQLLSEEVRIWQRQLTEGGTTALRLWFKQAERFYVPSASSFGPNIIDTTDLSEFVTHDDWESIPANQRTPADDIPVDKTFHATLVNEMQIELGEERPYVDRLDELEQQIQADEASLVMRYFASVNEPGYDPAVPATAATALSSLLSQPEALRAPRIAALNQFLSAQRSALRPLTAEKLERLAPELFTAQNAAKPVRTADNLEMSLDGARFVFEQLLDVQRVSVDAKGDRILRALRGAGLRTAEWKQTQEAKGELGLRLVQGIA